MIPAGHFTLGKGTKGRNCFMHIHDNAKSQPSEIHACCNKLWVPLGVSPEMAEASKCSWNRCSRDAKCLLQQSQNTGVLCLFVSASLGLL